MDILSAVYLHAVVLSALAVVVVQQLLKWQVVPTKLANRFPVPTNIILSFIASVVAVWQSHVPTPANWTDWIVLVATVSVSAAITYNATLRNWVGLRNTESKTS